MNQWILLPMQKVVAGHVISHPLVEMDKQYKGKWLVIYIHRDYEHPHTVHIIKLAKLGPSEKVDHKNYQVEHHQKILGCHEVRYYGLMLPTWKKVEEVKRR